MKRIVALTSFALCCFTAAEAQNFLDRLQTEVEGQGVVTVHQDSDITRIVVDPQSTVKPDERPHGTTTTTHTAATTTTRVRTDNDTTTVTTPTRGNGSTRKVAGYRVQAFAGGNSRRDRQQAERVGNAIRSRYPNVPVSVHFYSPRWICRVGNYRTYEEAEQMLINIQNMGYRQAFIVKGRVTVR